MLLEAIEGLKKKLDLELEKKWELIQQLRDEENSHQGLISFLWGYMCSLLELSVAISTDLVAYLFVPIIR